LFGRCHALSVVCCCCAPVACLSRCPVASGRTRTTPTAYPTCEGGLLRKQRSSIDHFTITDSFETTAKIVPLIANGTPAFCMLYRRARTAPLRARRWYSSSSRPGPAPESVPMSPHTRAVRAGGKWRDNRRKRESSSGPQPPERRAV
jgi:hypothetical protein